MFIAIISGTIYFTLFQLEVKFEDSKKIEESLAQTEEESYMESVQYYKISEVGKEVELNSFYLKMKGDDYMEFNFPEGMYYSKDNRTFKYRAFTAEFDRVENFINLNGDVVVETLDSVISAAVANYDIAKEKVSLEGNVISTTTDRANGDSIIIRSAKVLGYPKENRLRYNGNVIGEVKRKRVFEGGVDFKSKELNLDLEQGQIDLTGDVYFKKQQVTATSLRGKIFLENYNKKLKYYALYDDVKIVEKLPPSAGVEERKAFAENLEGHVREKKLVLSGSPKVIQGDNVILGNLITLFEKTQVVEVDDATTNVNFDSVDQ